MAEIVSICLGVTVVVILFGGAVFYRYAYARLKIKVNLFKISSKLYLSKFLSIIIFKRVIVVV